MRLLIVEPDKEISAITSMFCHLVNLTAYAVHDIKQACLLAKNIEFDGVILDVSSCSEKELANIERLRQCVERPRLRQRFIGTSACRSLEISVNPKIA